MKSLFERITEGLPCIGSYDGVLYNAKILRKRCEEIERARENSPMMHVRKELWDQMREELARRSPKTKLVPTLGVDFKIGEYSVHENQSYFIIPKRESLGIVDTRVPVTTQSVKEEVFIMLRMSFEIAEPSRRVTVGVFVSEDILPGVPLLARYERITNFIREHAAWFFSYATRETLPELNQEKHT